MALPSSQEFLSQQELIEKHPRFTKTMTIGRFYSLAPGLPPIRWIPDRGASRFFDSSYPIRVRYPRLECNRRWL